MNENRKRFVELVYSDDPKWSGLKAFGLKEAFENNERFDRWWSENVVLDVREEMIYLRFYNDYSINLKKIKTHQDILSWVHHLLGKQWISEYEDGPYILSRLIETICALKKVKLYK